MNIKKKKSIENPAHYKFEQVNCYNCGADDFSNLLIAEDDLTGKEGNFQYVICNNLCMHHFYSSRDSLQEEDFYKVIIHSQPS